MVNEISVQICDTCNLISPDVNCSNDTCMDCGEKLVVVVFVRRPTPLALDGGDSAARQAESTPEVLSPSPSDSASRPAASKA